jgi:hypothetical protein
MPPSAAAAAVIMHAVNLAFRNAYYQWQRLLPAQWRRRLPTAAAATTMHVLVCCCCVNNAWLDRRLPPPPCMRFNVDGCCCSACCYLRRLLLQTMLHIMHAVIVVATGDHNACRHGHHGERQPYLFIAR